MMRLLRVAIVVALLAGLVAATQQWVARRSAARDESVAPRPRPAPLVRTMEVDPTHLVEQRTFPAEVRASATVDIVSRIPGRLGAVLVREGSFVNAGSLVARLDDPDITLAVTQAEAAVAVQRARLAQLRAGPRAPEVAHVEAQIAQQEAALAQAERDLARAQQLFSEGLVARAAVDRAQTEVDLARARVRQSREQLAVLTHGPRPEDVEAQIAQVRQAEVQLAQARARLRELRITSPIAGVVTRLNVESGAVISSQTVLATVATIQPIEVHVLLPETDLPRLRKTSTVRITVDAIPERVFEGRIARVAPTLESATRSARLILVVPNTDAALRPGMFARATVVFDERQAIVIPSDAIVRRGEAAVVFVVKGDTVEERPVGIGYVEGGRTEIVEGLASGEAVVVAGQQGLRDGMKVRTGSGPPGPPGGPPGQTVPPSPGGGSSRP